MSGLKGKAANLMRQTRFAWRILISDQVSRNRTCPYCGSADVREIARKRILLRLLCCGACSLRFRWPKETCTGNQAYYQYEYSQPGLTTNVPPPGQLDQLNAANFAGSEKDLTPKLQILSAFVPAGMIFDYGCSWGYGVKQLHAKGYESVGFEISSERAAFGTSRLGLTILTHREQLSEYVGRCDAVFCSHVLEHLPTPRGAFEDFARLLKPGGYLILFVPNGDGESARRLGSRWSTWFGREHSLALDASFLRSALPAFGFKVVPFSVPVGDRMPADIRGRFESGGEVTPLSDELIVIARRNDSGGTQG